MLSLVDSCLTASGHVDGLSVGRIIELRKRIPKDNPYGNVLADVGLFGVHDAVLAKGFTLTAAITLQGATTKAAEGLADLKEKLGAVVVNSALGTDGSGSNRLEQVEKFLRIKSRTVTVQILESRDALLKELSEHCVQVEKELPQLPFHNEASFMKKMKGLAA